ASFPIPEVIRDINAIQLALDKYNPGTEIKVVWVNTWFDPGKEADAANALIDQGVDVVFQHTDSPAPIQAAERRGVYSVGYASDPIPEVIRDINAIQLALDKYNPGTEIKVVWVNTWFDPGKEADAANALIDQGVDVVFQHTDSPAPIQAAERRGVYSVGYASDMQHFGPKAVLTSIVNDWGPHYAKSAEGVIDGSWKAE